MQALALLRSPLSASAIVAASRSTTRAPLSRAHCETTTDDFPNIFENVLNTVLLARYELQTPTYRRVAAERPFNDFRPHPQVRAGEFPPLQPVAETGELKYGTSNDYGTKVSITPYGVVYPISRTMLVNDELGAIDQMLGSAGRIVAIFENQTFWNMVLSNPVLTQDSTAVFASGHNNLAVSGGVPSVTNYGLARAALRSMQTPDGNYYLNVEPRIVVTGPLNETAAEQMRTRITPMLTTSVNPFEDLEFITEPAITTTAWYVLADPDVQPNFIFGNLKGSEGPRIRIFEPFGTQGIKISVEEDLGVGAIDFRGAYLRTQETSARTHMASIFRRKNAVQKTEAELATLTARRNRLEGKRAAAKASSWMPPSARAWCCSLKATPKMPRAEAKAQAAASTARDRRSTVLRPDWPPLTATLPPPNRSFRPSATRQSATRPLTKSRPTRPLQRKPSRRLPPCSHSARHSPS